MHPWGTILLLLAAGASPAEGAVGPELIGEALRSPDVGGRVIASRAIVASGTSSLRWILPALRDRDYRIRVRAARLVLQIGDRRALPHLLDGLYRDDPASEARAAFAWAAYRLGHQPALDVVRRELGHRYWHRRLGAVRDLARLRDAGVGELLRSRLRDGVWLVRLRAFEALESFDLLRDPDELSDLVSDREWVLRLPALTALLRLGPLPAESAGLLEGALALALVDEEVAIRRMAARTLAARPVAARALAESVTFGFAHDRDDRIRGHLLEAATALGGTRTDRRLRRALRDSSFWVRATATRLWAARGRKTSVRAALGRLATVDPEEAPAAAVALRRIGDLEAVALLTRSVVRGGRRGRVALAVLAALGRMTGRWRTAVETEISGLLGANLVGRRRAGAALAEALGDPGMVPLLVPQLSFPAASVRSAAARALGRIAPGLPGAERTRVARALLPLARRAAARVEARAALTRLVVRGLPPAALDLLVSSPSIWARALGLRALGTLGGAVSTARQALADPAPPIREAAVVALAASLPPGVSPAVASRAGPPPDRDERETRSALDAIAGRLGDEVLAVRAAAARALWTAGDPRGRAVLRAVLASDLEDRKAAVRRAAARDLARLASGGDRPAAAALVQALLDPDRSVRRRARRALLSFPDGTVLRPAAAGRGMLRYAAAYLLAARGDRSEPGRALGPLLEMDPAALMRLGEYQPARLARLLEDRVAPSWRGRAASAWLRLFLAPDLLAELAVALGEETRTWWRASAPYNVRRQNLFNREIAAAIREFPGLHPKILKSLLFQESNLEPLAGNQYDCVGLGAFCRSAGREEGLRVSDRFRDFSADERYRPERAVIASVHHLRRKAHLLESGPFRKYGVPRGRDYWAFVLAAYNGGHHQVAEAMRHAYREGLRLARARRLRGRAAVRFARAHATQWRNLLAPDEIPSASALYRMTERRYPWYGPYGRYRRMKGAEAKYLEIGQFPLDILERAFEGEPSPWSETSR